MTSFKAKLVVYFLLLTLLPVAGVFWAYSSVAASGQTSRVDARLEGGLRAGSAAYQRVVEARRALAEALAREPAFQRALERRDAPALERFARRAGVQVTTRNGRRYGTLPKRAAARRETDVYTRSGFVGAVVAAVPLDARLARQIDAASGLPRRDAVAIVAGSRVLAASGPLTGTLSVQPGFPTTVRIGGTRYRALASSTLEHANGARLVVLTPQDTIDAAVRSTREQLLLVLALVLVAVALLAYTQGRAIARALTDLVGAAGAVARGKLEGRVPVRGRDELAQLGNAFNEMADQLQERLDELESERARLRQAFARFGDALSATHDPDQLQRVVLEAAVEATGARGASLIDDRGALVQVGDIDTSGERLELPLTAGRSSFGTLVLVGDTFDDEARLTANSLVAHAVVALDNARLHRIVERQALVDGLTGLANRRQCEDALAAELARADRLGTPLTVVLADLDDFKQINDVYGHPTGDVVLREFANVLRENVREADIAGRWGGEEFVLLLPGTDTGGGALLAERIRSVLAERTILGAEGAPLRLTCSFGVATSTGAEGAEPLLDAADEALYRAKREGKNRVALAAQGASRP